VTARRPEAAEALRGLLSTLNASRPLEAILDAVLAQAGRLLGSEGGAVYLREDRDGARSDLLGVRASRGLDASELATQLRVGSPVTGLSVQEGRPVVCADLTAALADDIVNARETQAVDHGAYIAVLRMGPRLDPDLESGPSARIRRLTDRFRAVLAAPLTVRGRTWGAVALYYREPRAFADEDVELAAAFADCAALAIENAYLRARSDERMRGLQALYDADEKLHGSLRIDDVLGALVDVVTEVLHADKATVMIWDEAHERLVVGAVRGFAPETVAIMAHVPGEGLTARVARTGRPIVVEDVQADPRINRRIADPEGIRSLVHMPVLVGGEVIGVFGVHYCRRHAFTGDEQRLLAALAQRAGLAIENARLYEQAQQAAVLEERQRLARELHDAVTQTLFSARLIADVLPRIWSRDPAEGRARLEELRELTRGALAEMRTLLLELRPSQLGEAALSDLLGQLADALTARARVPVGLRTEGEADLPPDVKIALYRAAQEALHNTAKHAGAERVEVDLRLGPGRAELTVRDDGRGFDPAAVPPGRLGLTIMRERAEAVGATVAVESRPGGGTSVVVVWSEPAGAPTEPPKRR
jgi:signal transduction histidine kinase